eukprot:5436527-Pleurochrysis_carterae.AAC.1
MRELRNSAATRLTRARITWRTLTTRRHLCRRDSDNSTSQSTRRPHARMPSFLAVAMLAIMSPSMVHGLLFTPFKSLHLVSTQQASPRTAVFMGRGDARTAKGKRRAKSFGNSRPRNSKIRRERDGPMAPPAEIGSRAAKSAAAEMIHQDVEMKEPAAEAETAFEEAVAAAEGSISEPTAVEQVAEAVEETVEEAAEELAPAVEETVTAVEDTLPEPTAVEE